jgi:hypothetical protein
LAWLIILLAAWVSVLFLILIQSFLAIVSKSEHTTHECLKLCCTFHTSNINCCCIFLPLYYITLFKIMGTIDVWKERQLLFQVLKCVSHAWINGYRIILMYITVYHLKYDIIKWGNFLVLTRQADLSEVYTIWNKHKISNPFRMCLLMCEIACWFFIFCCTAKRCNTAARLEVEWCTRSDEVVGCCSITKT